MDYGLGSILLLKNRQSANLDIFIIACMALITFLSDFGDRDHYVSAVKAKIYAADLGLTIVDITHSIEPFNIAHGAFVLKSVFRDFPEGTVHIVGVNSINRGDDNYVALELEGHYFIGTDNGIFSLLSQELPSQVVRLPHNGDTIFPEKDIFAVAACELANRGKLESIGEETPELKRMIGRELRITDAMILGNIIHVDHYGNLIVNVDLETFDAARAGRSFTIKFAREGVSRINDSYRDVDEGDCCVTFNSLGLLEISINKGNAAQLLGLKYDSPVIISFS